MIDRITIEKIMDAANIVDVVGYDLEAGAVACLEEWIFVL